MLVLLTCRCDSWLYSFAVYSHTGKNRYQLEVPEVVLKRAGTPDEYRIQSSKKGFKRYWTDDIETKLAELKDAEDKRDAVLQDTMRRIFYNFDKELVCLKCIDQLWVICNYKNN